jgi:hypothetical protein
VCCKFLNQGHRLSPLPQDGRDNAQLFTQPRTLRTRQENSLNFSTVGSISPRLSCEKPVNQDADSIPNRRKAIRRPRYSRVLSGPAKATSGTADMHVLEKSDCAVLPVNRPNKGGKHRRRLGREGHGPWRTSFNPTCSQHRGELHVPGNGVCGKQFCRH